MRLTLVVAAATNGVIGRDGGLPWPLTGDQRHFKALTMGHPMVMGRRTYESIGRPLYDLRDKVTQELLRRGSNEARVPIDREPVPAEYADSVRRYYERLGSGR